MPWVGRSLPGECRPGSGMDAIVFLELRRRLEMSLRPLEQSIASHRIDETLIDESNKSVFDQDTVLYDGQCRFCTRQIAHLRRMDGRGRLRFLSLHDPSVAVWYPDLSMDQMMEEMWIVTRQGDRFGGADAIRYLTGRLPILWPLFPWMHLPGMMPVWRWMYRQVAKRRYRIAGRNCDDGTCSLHDK